MRERVLPHTLPIELEPYDAAAPVRGQRAGTLTVCAVPLGAPVVPGELDEGNGAYVLATLQRACDGNLSGEFAAVVMRKDPPFDLEYVTATWLLERAEAEGARVFNKPRALRDHSRPPRRDHPAPPFPPRPNRLNRPC